MRSVTLTTMALILSTVIAAQSWAEDMVMIKGGSFTMGSPAAEIRREKDETPHLVAVGDFLMARYEVTQSQFQAIMGSNPSNFQGGDLPVENVTWYEAVAYCNAISQKEGLAPAYEMAGTGNNQTVTWNPRANGYRLPTEAEWEYACRAGTTGPFNTGDNVTTDQANYYGNYPYHFSSGPIPQPNGAGRESRPQPLGII